MADIRINALATTAASTASDDYIAIDGSANGTRKLNAYSPTFGGNLTVSGTGTFGGTNLINVSSGTPAFQISNAAGGGGLKTELNYNTSAFVTQLRALATPGSGTIFSLRTIVGGTEQDTLAINYLGNATLSGNLTVSGGTISSGAGNTLLLQQANYGGGLSANASGQVIVAAYNSQPLRLQTQGADVLYLTSSGNALIGTSTDSGNGKLQLATHTTSAGGIGFGTDTSLYRTASGSLAVYGSGSDIRINFSHSTSTANKGFDVQLDTSKDAYVWQRENRNLYFGTNNTTALTLDSSQNATFAGFILNRTNNKGIYTGTLDNCGFTWTGTNGEFSTASGSLILKSAGTTALTLDASQNATFAGTIKPQQAATASAPTYVKGAIYFDTTLNKLRVGGATGWETITSV